MRRLLVSDVKSYNDNGKSTGHYFAVAQNYLDLYSDYCKVEIAGGPIFTTHFNSKDIFLLPYDYMPSINWLKSKLRVLKNCKYLFRHTLPDDIIVIQQSGLSTAILGIALFANVKHNIYVIAYDTDAVVSPIKKLIFKFAKRKIKGLLCPHEHVAKAYGLPNCKITDYIYVGKSTKPAISFDNKKYDIAIVGSISYDKGVLEAAKALIKTNLKVLIAGRGDKQLTDRLKEICDNAKNIELHIGFISDENYYEYIREARFCILNYHGVYEDRSSGVALDIIFNGTPILGHSCIALSFIKKESLGLLFDDINNFNFNDIINKKEYEKYQISIKKYLDSQKKYKQSVVDFLHL